MSRHEAERAAAPISLAEFIRSIEQIDLASPDDLWQARGLLRALAADSGWLVTFLAEELATDIDRFQQNNLYDAHTLLLVSDPRYLLRANIWVPLGGSTPASDPRDFSYGIAHNHNFHLLSVGMIGPGYETDLLRLAEADRLLRPGDPVTLTPSGSVQLGPGVILLYEAYCDVHVQRPSAALSVSLNLMTRPKVADLPQVVLDPASGVVTEVLEGRVDGRLHLAEAARDLLGAEGRAALARVAANDPSPRVRAAAKRAMDRDA